MLDNDGPVSLSHLMNPQAALRRALERYSAPSPEEMAVVGRMLGLLAHTPAPLSREQFSPGHFTASVFIVSPQASELLLVYHSKLRRWLQPGGHIEAWDASIEAAALREVEEEVGLIGLELVGAGIFDVDIHDIAARGSDPDHEHFDVRYLALSRSQEVRAASDALAARWVPILEVPRWEKDPSVERAARKISPALVGRPLLR